MTTTELLVAAGSGASFLLTSILGGGKLWAFLRERSKERTKVELAQIAADERTEEKLWIEVGELKREVKKCAEEREQDREECAENVAALQSMVFRSLNIGDDTGKFLIDEARETVRSKRPSPPPPAKREDGDG